MQIRKHFSLRELLDKPTIRIGQTDDLKFETPSTRVWLSRLTKADGMECDHQVTVECREDGPEGTKWITVEQYQAV